jgi:hypothetical protein
LCPFRSEDKTKDAGYAQLCISKYLDEAKIRKPAMKRVIIATDGGRQHFKLFQNMHFMSEQHILRGLKLWWLFFQSYHGEAVTSPTVCCRFAMSCKEQCSVMRIRPIAGKGPADGGGNWLKSALALACLAGVSISNVYEVFMYALRNLVNNKTTSNFNEGRYYYYVTLYELAEYRSHMPAEVKGSLNIQPGKTDGTGWFFWASTDTAGQLVQRRTACTCDACYDNAFDSCSEKDHDQLQDEWFNEPRVNELTVSTATQGKSLKECRRSAKTAKRDDVMAIRAGEINERTHVNDESVAGLVDVDGSDSDFWLCVVVESFTTVLEAAGKTVEGKHLQRKDEYLVVQWLELIEGCNGREYELCDARDCIWELSAILPVKKLGRYTLPSSERMTHKARPPYQLTQVAKKALDALA